VPGDGNPQTGSPEFAWPRLVDPVEPLDRDSFIVRRGRGGTRLLWRVRTDCKPRANNCQFGVKMGGRADAVNGGNSCTVGEVYGGADQSPRSCA